MENKHTQKQFDLITDDGQITHLVHLNPRQKRATVQIKNILKDFVGFEIDQNLVEFNIKSTLAQLGLNTQNEEVYLDSQALTAHIELDLYAIDGLGEKMLNLIEVGAHIGKLFAADDRRQVKDPIYLSRMFGRSDRWGNPLLSLGGLHGSRDLILEKVEGRTVAFLGIVQGCVSYDKTIEGLLATIAKALIPNLPVRKLLQLHHIIDRQRSHTVKEGELLLVHTLPLHIRTVFARVVNDLLGSGYQHTSASVLQPDTYASGDIYELFGSSIQELPDIPLEFYTLESFREYIFFKDRDQLQTCLENSETLFQAFNTAPKDLSLQTATFVSKGENLLNLTEADWTSRQIHTRELPGLGHGERQGLLVTRYIEEQPSYPYLLDIDNDIITSQGILLSRYLPSPFMKRMLLSNQVQNRLKGIYFQYPSQSHQGYFSAEDRAMLHDLYNFALPVFWVDSHNTKILQYVEKPGKDTGLFVPIDKINTFLKATLFGIYGSNLLEDHFEEDIRSLLKGILKLSAEVTHPLLNNTTPIAMVTGGGPGAMEVGNRIAQSLGILSCANIVDFRSGLDSAIKEQEQNPYIDAKMTYRLDKLVERQAEFNLDFPIFLRGGIGTDFEFCLEEVRRKVSASTPTPVLLFGDKEFWQQKITPRFQCNRKNGTITGSEWLSNCFYFVNNSQEGLRVYRDFFQGKLNIGPDGDIYDEGFVSF